MAPDAASNQNARYYAVYYDSTSVGIDGSAWAALNALYVAANYTVPRAAAFQIGYQGQGSTRAATPTARTYGSTSVIWE